jgi:hypothetical protein
MSPRDTGTGRVLEQMVIPSFQRGGYNYQTHINVGEHPGGGQHIIDYVVSNQNCELILISMKWQQVGGTAEQKIPYEVICLVKALKNNGFKYRKAYLVLGGGGWKLRDFYVKGGLEEYLRDKDRVTIITLESFIALANKGNL